MKIMFVCIFGLFLMSACATPQVRREKFVSSRQGLPERHKDAILRGSVFEGMSKREVLASWGRPQRAYKKIFGSIPARHWEYDITQPDRIDTYVLIFRNGIMMKMTLKHSKPMSGKDK